MTSRKWLVGLLVLAAAVAGAVASVLYVAAAPMAETASLTVTMSGATQLSGTQVEYTINVANASSATVSNIYVAGGVPSGAKFNSVTSTPTGTLSVGVQADGTVAWVIPSIDAGGKQALKYVVAVTPPVGAARAFVHWLEPTEGTAVSADVTFQAAINAGGPNRGCQACHVLIDPTLGFATLAFEAHERVEADFPGLEHPTKSPSGVSIKPTDQTSPAPCLECHAPGTGDRTGKGNVAPLALRDIVHPAHMFSPFFKEHYNGSCFTCHNVRGDGTFELLGDKVITNEKGVPRSLLEGTGIIPGEILPSERK